MSRSTSGEFRTAFTVGSLKLPHDRTLCGRIKQMKMLPEEHKVYLFNRFSKNNRTACRRRRPPRKLRARQNLYNRDGLQMHVVARETAPVGRVSL